MSPGDLVFVHTGGPGGTYLKSGPTDGSRAMVAAVADGEPLLLVKPSIRNVSNSFYAKVLSRHGLLFIYQGFLVPEQRKEEEKGEGKRGPPGSQ